MGLGVSIKDKSTNQTRGRLRKWDCVISVPVVLEVYDVTHSIRVGTMTSSLTIFLSDLLPIDKSYLRRPH